MYSTQAPAKINLGLHVLRRRNDGYHDVETVLLPIQWYDIVTVRSAERTTMTCTDSELPTDERNLCIRAARLLARAAEVTAGAGIHLEKHIPYGAGLGGGSSDAAAALVLLSRLWELSWSAEQLHGLARRLGADVPFFLHERAALASGRGDELTMLDADYTFPYRVVVVKPSVSVSTPEAYRLVEPVAAGRPDIGELVASNDLTRWRSTLTNDFEEPIFEKFPEVAGVKQQLLQHGAGYASLSGSGAAVYGIFTRAPAARRAAEYFRSQEQHTVWWGCAVTGSSEQGRIVESDDTNGSR